MPKISIYRVSEFENRMRKIHILIDGEPKAKIGNGKNIDLEIAAGKHTAQAKIDWCTSNLLEFEIDNESNIRLELRSGKGFVFYRVIFGYQNYLQLNEVAI